MFLKITLKKTQNLVGLVFIACM